MTNRRVHQAGPLRLVVARRQIAALLQDAYARWTHIPSLCDARLMDLAASAAPHVQLGHLGTVTRAQTSWIGSQRQVLKCTMAVEERMLNMR